eukprot:COSAG01_NODE_1821_length_9119_cov_4.375345_12_plen_81_part_00
MLTLSSSGVKSPRSSSSSVSLKSSSYAGRRQWDWPSSQLTEISLRFYIVAIPVSPPAAVVRNNPPDTAVQGLERTDGRAD